MNQLRITTHQEVLQLTKCEYLYVLDEEQATKSFV